MYEFSSRSIKNLDTCCDELQLLFSTVILNYDCTIIEGHRTMERQKELFREGKSKTLGSKHLSSPSNAVDVMPYPIDWSDQHGQHVFATKVLATAIDLGIKVRWGGSFKNFYDAPHWELYDE